MAKVSDICSPSAKPFALATDQLLVRDGPGTARGDGLGAARVPDVEEYERRSGHVQRPEVFRLTRLIDHFHRGQCHGAT